MNGVPICGRCYNAVRAAQQQKAAQTGTGAVSQTATTQELVTGSGQAPSVLPAPVPFSQAAVPIDQVFQSSPEPEVEEPPPARATPPGTSRDSARRTGVVPAPAEQDGRQVYLVGGIAAAAAFIIVVLGYYLIFGRSRAEPAGKGDPATQQANATNSPSLPPSLPPALPPNTQTPALPPPVTPPANPDVTQTPATNPDTTASALDQEFENIRQIPDQEKDRKVAALNTFIEKCTDPIILARAKTLLTKLAGPPPKPPEAPLEPTTATLANKSGGLVAEYFRGRDLNAAQLITKQTDLLISMNTRNPRPPGVPREEFSARWEGYLHVEKDGLYTICTISDDGVRVFLGDRKIIENWGDHGSVRDEKTLELKSGYYKLKVEYYQGTSDGEITLRWALKDGFDERTITADNLFHEAN